MAAASEGPNWQGIAMGLCTVMMLVLTVTGWLYISQQNNRDATQAAHDSRQDTLLDAISTKMIDVTVTLVKIQQSATDAKLAADRAAATLEDRDQRELAEYRHRADQTRDEKPAGKK